MSRDARRRNRVGRSDLRQAWTPKPWVQKSEVAIEVPKELATVDLSIAGVLHSGEPNIGQVVVVTTDTPHFNGVPRRERLIVQHGKDRYSAEATSKPKYGKQNVRIEGPYQGGARV